MKRLLVFIIFFKGLVLHAGGLVAPVSHGTASSSEPAITTHASKNQLQVAAHSALKEPIASSSGTNLRTRILRFALSHDAQGNAVPEFKEHDRRPSEQLPELALRIQTQNNIFYIDIENILLGNGKLLNSSSLSLSARAKLLSYFNFRRFIQSFGVSNCPTRLPYTKIRRIENTIGNKLISAQIDSEPLSSDPWRTINFGGSEIIFRDAKGNPYTSITSVRGLDSFCQQLIVAYIGNGIQRIFKLDGSEIVLTSTNGQPYTDAQYATIRYFTYDSFGKFIVAKLRDETMKPFNLDGSEIVFKAAAGGSLFNITGVKALTVGGSSILVTFDDASFRIFKRDGSEIILKDKCGRSIPYTSIVCIYSISEKARIYAVKFNNEEVKIFNLDGLEVELKNNAGLVYGYVSSFSDYSGTIYSRKFIGARFENASLRIFNSDGSEIVLKKFNENSPHVSICNFKDFADGKCIEAQFVGGTRHIFNREGFEILLKDTNDRPYGTTIKMTYDIANGERFAVKFEDNTVHIFNLDGSEVAVLKDPSGKPYTTIDCVFDVANGKFIEAIHSNDRGGNKTLHFNFDGSQLVLKCANGQPCGIVDYYVANEKFIMVELRHGGHKVFNLDGSELVLKDAKGRLSSTMYFVGEGRIIVAEQQFGIWKILNSDGSELRLNNSELIICNRAPEYTDIITVDTSIVAVSIDKKCFILSGLTTETEIVKGYKGEYLLTYFKAFGPLTIQKLILLLAAREGLLQEDFAISVVQQCKVEDGKIIEREYREAELLLLIYQELPEKTQEFLQQASFNVAKRFHSQPASATRSSEEKESSHYEGPSTGKEPITPVQKK